jgi:2-oxo-4-hydroxy-4-carboxy--5-ureidoimidazoline (OHCU) decarboxylase
MVNYAKANRIKQEITAEKEKAAGLDKRYQNENRKFIKLKDSIQRYNNLILTGKNAK